MKTHQIATFLCNKNRPRLETALEIAGAKCYVSEAWVKVRGDFLLFFFVGCFCFGERMHGAKMLFVFFSLEKKWA